MIRLHKFPELRRYNAPLTSTASLLNILIVMFTMITVPVLLAYFSYGFYIETYTYYERPSLQFAGKLIAQIQTDKNPIYFTSITELSSQNVGKEYLIPTMSYEQSDDSSELRVAVRMSIPKAESVYALSMILLFETGLYAYETADLSLMPKQLISKLKDNSNRTVFGDVEHRLLYWQPTNTQTVEFTTNLSFRLPYSRISVYPGFWFTVKFAWIQYLTVALPFLYAGERLRVLVYGNQLVTTTVTSTRT
ncbi:transmembrane protein 231 [Paragonimus westermani]|uniref:Transmembrane protein 231 n=1 Tax=Paragonimus westermani TaxID=34504 RepID=A0A5J4NPM5_9TREM|nr:transmembrane protein 231 [Paragonimus westermani]